MVFYRAHELSGNTAFVDTLCEALAERGATPLPVFCASLRSADAQLAELLNPADAVITTVLAAGGSAAADATGESDWDAGLLAGLDVPVLQGLCLTSSRAQWEASNAALAPIDAAMQVAIPEFDGRLITVPFSFKEEGPDGIPRYAADPERAARLAGIAVRHAQLARTPNAAKRVAIMLSSYPTKHSRVGNAVGLDTPASAVALLRAMRAAGYDLGEGFPEDGDTLIHALIAAGGHDTEWLTEDQLRAAPARVPLAAYRRFFSDLPNGLGSSIQAHWGPPPGELYTDESTGDIVLACLRFGNVVLMIQPPRGFGENPVAIYHDPDLPPSHHYLAAYRWLAGDFRADAIVHLGKHGTLEWLPGKGLGLSAECAPDAVLGDLPLVYPFIVNDPGEGTQAKRRGHAVIVDHLVPPMARADTYGEMAKLEQLLDEYATVAALDPDKLPALRAQIWSLIEAAHLHQDLGVDAQPGSAEFDNFVLHIDGYLCEVKDAAIRDGLHILGAAPSGEALVNLVLVILRAPQLWSARWGALPGLRDALREAVGQERSGPPGHATPVRQRLRAGVSAQFQHLAAQCGRECGQRGHAVAHGRPQRAVAAVVAGGALLDMAADHLARRPGQLAVPAVEQQVELGAAAPPGARHEQGAERRLQLAARVRRQRLRLVPWHAEHGREVGTLQVVPEVEFDRLALTRAQLVQGGTDELGQFGLLGASPDVGGGGRIRQAGVLAETYLGRAQPAVALVAGDRVQPGPELARIAEAVEPAGGDD